MEMWMEHQNKSIGSSVSKASIVYMKKTMF